MSGNSISIAVARTGTVSLTRSRGKSALAAGSHSEVTMRVLKWSVTRLMLILAIWTCGPQTGWAQTSYRLTPTAPLLPTRPEQCDAFDRDWQQVRNEVDKQHSACLDSAPKNCPDDPKTT